MGIMNGLARHDTPHEGTKRGELGSPQRLRTLVSSTRGPSLANGLRGPVVGVVDDDTDRLIEERRRCGNSERSGMPGNEESAKRLLIHIGRLLEDGAGLRLQVHQPSRILRARRPTPAPRTGHRHGRRAGHGTVERQPGCRHGQHMVSHAGERMLESPSHEPRSGPGDRVRKRVVLQHQGVGNEDDEPSEGHWTYKLPRRGQQNQNTATKRNRSPVVI